MKGKKRLFLISGVIAGLVVLFAQCMDVLNKKKATENTIAGAESCKKCHQGIYENYLHNAHSLTSRPITGNDLVNGPLPGSNVFAFNEHLKLVIEKRKDGMYQVAYFDGKETIARRFDIAIGSGKDAYTYGSWEGAKLTQLPLSYFRQINIWANSPGFPANSVYFERPIGSRCLECHSSFVDHKTVKTGPLTVTEELDKASLIYGIDCERCHGPAGRHVEFHTDHPQEKEAKFIKLYKALTRKQKLDACGVCHSGNDLEVRESTFSFKPGDDISKYYDHAAGSFADREPDVHGNQSQMLAKSNCYIKSNMDCGTCHNTHETRKSGLTVYSKKCISCHAVIKHTEKTLANAMVKTNCIDCHMPEQPSKLISFKRAGRSKMSPYLLRTHQIAIY